MSDELKTPKPDPAAEEQGAPKTPMERLADFTRKLISVPKDEIADREREYEAQKRERKRRAK